MKEDLDIFKAQISMSQIEAEMLQCEQLEIPVEHTFSAGVYIRQITVPKGALILCKRHRFETCNILLKGELMIFVGEDKPPIVIKGPLLFTSPPLVRKLAYCTEDAIFANIHPTEETDLEKIEEHFIITEEEYKKFIKGSDQTCLGLQQQL